MAEADATASRCLALIVCHAKNRVIGKDGQLPWRYPEDLRHFKATTMGHAIIAGRMTHESIGRALPGRRNLVVSRRRAYRADGCEVFDSLDAAVAAAHETDDCPFVIGGAQVYAEALPRVTRMVVTEVQREVEGDVFFPEYD
ncbi:MAG: dihydrofolate reductase, partial [Planctomycetota bacterium]